MFLVRGLTEPLHGPLVTWLRAFTIFIGVSHLKLCICIALVRGLSIQLRALKWCQSLPLGIPF